MEDKIKLADYSYDSTAKVEIDGGLLMVILNVVNQVKQQETKEISLFQKAVIDKKEIIFEGVTMQDLYTQPMQAGITQLGVDCMGIQMALESIHKQAIDSGIAVKTENVGKFKL